MWLYLLQQIEKKSASYFLSYLIFFCHLFLYSQWVEKLQYQDELIITRSNRIVAANDFEILGAEGEINLKLH